MSLQFLPYTQDAVPAVREFNQRLLAGGAPADQQFPETPDPGWMPGMELFLAVEGSIVRGGYILRRQTFSCRPRLRLGRALPPASLRRHRESFLRHARTEHGARCARARTPPVRHGNGRVGQAAAADAQAPTLEDVRGPVPLQSGPPVRFLHHIRALRTSSFAPRRAGRRRVYRRRLAGHEGARPDAPPCRPDRSISSPAFARWADKVWGRSQHEYALLAAARRRHAGPTLSTFRPALPTRARGRRMGGPAGHADARPQAVRRYACGHHCGLPGARRNPPPTSFGPPPACWSSAAWI